jgi:hypothetical protein
LRFSFKIQVNENSEIVSGYVDIYYEIWLLIIESEHLKIQSELPEIELYCDGLKSYLVAIQENEEIINEENNFVTQELTQIINFINEHLTLLYTLCGNDWTVRIVFLDLLRFLENPEGTELEFVIMVIAVSCVKLLSAHNSTQHTSRKHKV